MCYIFIPAIVTCIPITPECSSGHVCHWANMAIARNPKREKQQKGREGIAGHEAKMAHNRPRSSSSKHRSRYQKKNIWHAYANAKFWQYHWLSHVFTSGSRHSLPHPIFCTQHILSWHLKFDGRTTYTLTFHSERHAPLTQVESHMQCLQAPHWPEVNLTLEVISGTEMQTKENVHAIYNPVRNRSDTL